MFRNNLKLILRKLKREKLYAIVNILGLTVGLTAFLLIALYVRDELSFDRFHVDEERTYRVIINDGDSKYRSNTPSDYIEYVAPEAPDIETYSRVRNATNPALIEYESKGVYIENGIFVDPNFFEFFSFQLIDVSPASIFKSPDEVVITESLAARLFDEENPIDEEIVLEKNEKYRIVAIAKNPPKNSTIQFDAVFHKNSVFDGVAGSPGYRGVSTYVKATTADVATGIGEKLTSFKDVPSYRAALQPSDFELLPIADQRLRAPYFKGSFSQNDIRFVMLFSAIGVVVLLLALINYINLVTSQAFKKMKEFGLRKVIGATRKQLILYQILESTTITTISFLFAFAIAERVMPTFNEVLDKEIVIKYFSSQFFMWVVIMGLLFGLLSGTYPAIVVSRYKPLSLISKNSTFGTKGRQRQVLVLFQFLASAVLIVALLIINSQMSYLKSKDLGFSPERLVSIPLEIDSASVFQTFKNEVLTIPGVELSSLSGFTLGGGWILPISNTPASKRTGGNKYYDAIHADQDILNVLDVKFKWKSPDLENGLLKPNQIIINESLARELNVDEPSVKMRFYGYKDDIGLELAGIVEDFHFKSMKNEIEPLFIQPTRPNTISNLLVRVSAENVNSTLSQIGEQFETQFERPFEFQFIDDQVANFYKKEQGQFLLFKVFSGLALLISMLGLLAMTFYSVEQRRKEVSIRKVLGASVKRLILMLNREYSTLVMVAFIIASPIAYYAMQGWLQEFKYRITLSPLIFIGAFLGFLALSWLVTIAQSLKVSRENPADVLRNE